MNPELLSRIQFTTTSSFHYLFPPISMGLGLMLVIIGIIYIRTGDSKWRRMSFFWVKVYGLVFALGIATGLVQEFEFGTNWSEYSRFVGNIFGSLLAAEGIFAFFLEGGFLGLMLFGGNRLGPRMWLLATFLVAFGAHFSALWIVMANSWMQTPAGYVMADGSTVPVMTSFMQVVFTPSFLARIGHVFVGAWIVGSSLMLSVSAWYLLRKKHVDLARSNFKVALPVFAIMSVLQLFVLGSQSAVNVTNNQPIKLAAMEGIWDTETCAPMTLIGWVNEETQTTVGIKIPCALSFLAYRSFDAPVTGLNAFPQDEWPPINLTFQSYHLMINLGVLFIGIGLIGVFYYFNKRKVFETRWVLWLFVATIFLAEVSSIAGWAVAEIGRQPWIVYGLLRTADAVSPTLTTGQVFASNIMFVALYAVLFFLFLYLLNEKIQHGPRRWRMSRPNLFPAYRIHSAKYSANNRGREVILCG
ncbi:MAG: cytochrome ubiquinol oxidase subunit I [Chloroflexota bacterium]